MVSLTAPVPQSSGPTLSKTKTKAGVSSRPSLLKKRTTSQAGMDIDESEIPSSPSKKAKVRFDSDVEVRTHEDFDKPIDLIREEVSRALSRQSVTRNCPEYVAIKNTFQNASTAESLSGLPSRRKLLQALARIPASLNNATADLVDAILKSDWVIRDQQYFDAFLQFIACLISSRSQWISSVLEMLVPKFARPLPVPSTDSLISRKQAQQRTHQLIQQVIDIAPLDGAMALRRILTKSFPSEWDSTKAHILFVHNALDITTYAPQLEAEILALITDRVVKIDVQVQTDLDDVEDLDDLLIGDTPEALDAFVDSLDDEEFEDDLDTSEDVVAAETTKKIRGNIQKMDMLLDLLFTYYDKASETTTGMHSDTYNMLESHFERIVLPAYRSRHTQFLVFHFAQSSFEYIDRFVGDCILRVTDKSRPTLVRHSAAAYLASFVARGAHVPKQTVRDVFEYLNQELTALREEYEPKCTGPDLRKFGAYYSLVQALLYIFCFRWRDLEVTPSEPDSSPEPYNSATIIQPDENRHVFIPKIKETLSRNVFSKLNPLKVCAPVIAEEFAKIAYSVGILYVHPLLETNKRMRLVSSSTSSVLDRETALSSRRDESMLQLDAYFPFDPYHLPRSKRWLDGDYRAWEGLTDDADEESNSEIDSDEDEDIDDDDGEEEDFGASDSSDGER